MKITHHHPRHRRASAWLALTAIGVMLLWAWMIPQRPVTTPIVITETMPDLPIIGTATVYHDKYQGRRTANGERFDQAAFTVAVPFERKGKRVIWRHEPGTRLVVKWYDAKAGVERLVTVRVNDLCPAGRYDLSKAAMIALTGKAYNKVPVLVHEEEQQ